MIWSPEFLSNTVELATGICESVPHTVEGLRETRDVVRRVAGQRGLKVFRAGSAKWPVSPR